MDDNPTRTRHPRNGALLSDARRVRFGEKITSEAVKGRLLLILILIISARAQNVKESGFEFCNFPFRRCKRPCGADVVVTGGVLLSVIYSYAARVRRNELRSNHRRMRDALTVKSAAVLCCVPKWIPAFFSHKRAITFERLYTGTKVFLCPPAHILMTSLPICPALFAVIRVGSATCSPLAAKTSMPVHHLPAPTCHDIHARLCACTLP